MPIWLILMRIELAMPLSMPCFGMLGVGDEQVVADQLHLLAQAFGEVLPAVPVAFVHAVLDRHDRVLVDQVASMSVHSAAVSSGLRLRAWYLPSL